MISRSFSMVGKLGLGKEVGWGVGESGMFGEEIGGERLSLGFVCSTLEIELGRGLSLKPKGHLEMKA